MFFLSELMVPVVATFAVDHAPSFMFLVLTDPVVSTIIANEVAAFRGAPY